MPKKKGMKDGEELLPIDLLRFVSRGNSFREDQTTIYPADSLATACICSDIAESLRDLDH
jgi:hypothetical protein